MGTGTGMGNHGLRTLLIVAVCTGLGVVSLEAQAQVRGASYEGDHTGTRNEFSPLGQRISFTVSDGGTAIANLTVQDLPFGSGLRDFSAAVRDHRFEVEVEAPPFGLPGPSCRYGSSTTVTGTFDSGQGVTGTIRDELIDCTFNVAATRNLSWSAKTDSKPVADTTAPNTRITKRPKNRVVTKARKARVKFAFTATEPNSTFQCRLDKRAWKSCASPKRYKVKIGTHRFKVRASDPAGNRDRTPSKDKFRVTR
jgi:hypothetical protein